MYGNTGIDAIPAKISQTARRCQMKRKSSAAPISPSQAPRLHVMSRQTPIQPTQKSAGIRRSPSP